MRKIFLFVCVLFTVASSAQVKQTYNQYGGLWNRLALKDSGALQLPRKPMGIKDFNGGLDTAQLMYRISDSAVLVWTGSQWRAIGGGATYTAGYGLFLTGTVFSLDSATAALTFLRRKDSAAAGFPDGYLTRTSVRTYSPGLQNVITQDPVLTANNDIDGGGFTLKWTQNIATTGGGVFLNHYNIINTSSTAAPSHIVNNNLELNIGGSGSIGTPRNVYGVMNFTSSTSSSSAKNASFDMNVNGSGTIGGSQANGIDANLIVGATGNVSVYSGFRTSVQTTAGSNIGIYEGVSIDAWSNAGTAGDIYGFYYGGYSNTGAGTTNNSYGLWIDSLHTAGTTNTYAIYTKNGNVRLGALPAGAATDSIMTWEAATGVVRKRNVASITGVNIYNSNGTLTGDRTVSAGGNDFQILNTPYFNIGDANTGERLGFGAATTYIYGPTVHGKIGYIQFDLDTLDINPSLGLLKIDTLTFVPGTKALRYNPSTGLVSYADTSTAAGGGATVALDNLSAVAINVALLPGTSDAIALGSTTKQWSDLFLAEGGVINWDNGDALLTQAASNLTLTGADFTVSGGVLYSNTAGGIGSGVVATASGSSSYASIDYVNDASTRFQTGLYGSAAAAPNKAFFYQACNCDIGFTTNNTERLVISGTGAIMMGSAGLYVGSVSTAPTSTLQSGGSFAGAYVAKSANYTATISDFTIECTANTFTVTLPTSVGITGRIYNIVNSGAGVITIATTSSQTFVNVVATPTTLTLSAVGNYQVQSNGANWMVLSVN